MLRLSSAWPAFRDKVVLSWSSARHVFSLEDLTSDGKLLCEW